MGEDGGKAGDISISTAYSSKKWAKGGQVRTTAARFAVLLYLGCRNRALIRKW